MAEIRYVGYIKKLTQVEIEELNADTITHMLKEIEKKYGEEAYKVAKQSHIFINHKSIAGLKGFRTPLKTSDIVQIVPVCGGG
ncbi:MAG: MoaD/ThiS family protein [Bacillota bacterium]